MVGRARPAPHASPSRRSSAATTELDALSTAARAARAEGGRGLVLLEAESGGGKTRLLDELARRAAETGAWVLRGQGVRPGPRRARSRCSSGVVPSVGGRGAARARGWPALRERLGEARGTRLRRPARAGARCSGWATAARRSAPRTFGEVRSRRTRSRACSTRSALGRRPALVLLDDCQWADELTLEAPAHWWRTRGATRDRRHVLVVAAFRSEEVGGRPPAAHARAVGCALELAAARPEQVRPLLESMAGPLPAEAVEVVTALVRRQPVHGVGGAARPGRVRRAGRDEPSRLAGRRRELLADVQSSRRAAAFLVRRLEPAPAGGPGAAVGRRRARQGVRPRAARRRWPSRQPGEAVAALEEARRRHMLWATRRRRRAARSSTTSSVRRCSTGCAPERAPGAAPPRAGAELEASRRPSRGLRARLPLRRRRGRPARPAVRARAADDRARAQYALESRRAAVPDRRARGRRPPTSEHRGCGSPRGSGDVLMLRGHYDEAAGHLTAARSARADEHASRGRSRRQAGRARVQARRHAHGPCRAHRARAAAARPARAARPAGSPSWLALAWEVLVQALHTLAARRLPGRRRRRSRGRAELLAITLYSRLAYVYWFERGQVPCALGAPARA